MTTTIENWSRLENDGSGDYYLVPEGLFTLSLEESADDPDFFSKLQKCVYVGGLPAHLCMRGEIK